LHLIAGVVLAAGAGRRFGGTKQLADLDGRPLLQHALDAANAEQGLDSVIVVLGHEADRVRGAVDLGRAEVTIADGWKEGQAASLRAGVRAAGNAEAVVVLLGDQPHPVPGAVDRVLAARGEAFAVRARYGGKPGHPVVLEHHLFGDLMRLRGDQGARDLLAEHPVTEVEMDAEQHDVDTPEELERMRR
jgi:CTP:molybdopterin cytidylyltransferase MocA